MINRFGRLKDGLRVLLCFAYRFAMSTFKFVILVRLAILAINFWFLNFWGCGAYLGFATFVTFYLEK